MNDRPLRALVVDDEPLGRANLRHALAAFPRWRLLGEAASAAEARARLEREPADLVFLDVQMPRESGLVLARELAARPQPPLVVFVTAHQAHAVEAFELHALDYLLKPFDDERFRQCLERVEALLSLRDRAGWAAALRGYAADAATPPPVLTTLSVRSVGRVESIPVADVLWIGAAGNYATLHLAGGREVLHRATLTLLESRLDPAQFLRVHRSALVRRDQCVALRVEGDGVYALELRSGATVAVSERHVQAVRQLLA
ncbi:MAG: LytTR family DNA-binding domain-containing protein [Vicinamibacteria bacterium]|nr:LytTR family DNA-binding domain-containing protein [Vicinamibacteria bacterium]